MDGAPLAMTMAMTGGEASRAWGIYPAQYPPTTPGGGQQGQATPTVLPTLRQAALCREGGGQARPTHHTGCI